MTCAPPILEYANGQPSSRRAESRFEVTETADGVTVQRSTTRRPSARVLVDGRLAVAAIAAAAQFLVARFAPVGFSEDAVAIAGGTATAAFVGWVLIQVSAGGPAVLTITLQPGRVTVVNGRRSVTGRPRSYVEPREFTVTPPPRLSSKRTPRAALVLHAGTGCRRRLLGGLLRAECRWLAGVLNRGLARTSPDPR